MAALDQKALQNELKKKRICRFCLSQDPTLLTNIFFRDTRIKSSAPLPIQVMAIASIEIYSNDGMPSYVCSDCISMFEYSYQFIQMCKRADNLLRQYPFVGKWPESLKRPIMPLNLLRLSLLKQSNINSQSDVQQSKQNVAQESLLLRKKINEVVEDNTNNNENNSGQIVTKLENVKTESSITYLEKIDNNDELSIDDIQLLVASEDVAEEEYDEVESVPVVLAKPRLLNKSSVRVLNKDASRDNEPRLSLPKIKKGEDGNMEIVAEILNVDDKCEEEPDPTNAEPIETSVFPCPYCERTFPLKQLRDIHTKNHLRDRKFHCDECDKSFFSKYDLNRHAFVHNGKKPFKCAACDKAFSRKGLLSRHEQTHTDLPKFICVHCERSFLSKEDMDLHAEQHNKYRRFKCKLCSKSFVFKQGLERHEVKHSVQQPFPCQYCEQSFSTTSKLARHLKAHSGLRPYPCKYCKKSFLLPHHLTRHLRSHKNINENTNAVNFMCSICKTSFESRDELIQHSKNHAGEHNLGCPLCKETFDSINILTNHIQDHSEGEAYACEFCDLIFMEAEKLEMHTDIDHTQEMEAYHADDRAQVDKMNEDSTGEKIDVSDENLQNEVNAFLMEEFLDDTNDSNDQLQRKIKSEQETLPKIINEIVIKSGTVQTKNDKVEDKADENNSLLIPLKQRKIDMTDKNVITAQAKTVVQNKKSSQIIRKVANTTIATRSTNQPTLYSLFKNLKEISETTSESNPTVQKTLLPKVKKDSPQSSSATKAAEKQEAAKTSEKKVQKIRVTKAEAAAMARDGRIKIKDGKMILKT